MATTETRIIHTLPSLEWGGLKAYVSEVQTSWSHMLAERSYYQVDGAAHEWTHREPFKVRTSLRFLNTIASGQYPGQWNKWRTALLLGEARDLKHPDIGKFKARPTDVSYSISSRSTAGITVDVDFVESIASADEPTKFETQGASAMQQAAEDADFCMGELGVDYPDGMSQPSFEAMVSEITTFGFTIQTELAGQLAQIQNLSDSVFQNLQLSCKLQAFAETAVKEELSNSPLRWLLEDSLTRLHALALDTAKAIAAGARKTKTWTTDRAQSLASVSLDLDADIADLIKLNPKLLQKPIVEKGSVVVYYADL